MTHTYTFYDVNQTVKLRHHTNLSLFSKTVQFQFGIGELHVTVNDLE